MKVLQLSCVAIAYLLMGGFSPQPLISSTYYYYSGTDNQRMEPGHTTETSLCERSLNSANFKDALNWTTTLQPFTSTTDLSKYIGSISFNEEFDIDGGSDGQLTLQEALNAVYNVYAFSNTIPPVITVGAANIYITAATACH